MIFPIGERENIPCIPCIPSKTQDDQRKRHFQDRFYPQHLLGIIPSKIIGPPVVILLGMLGIARRPKTLSPARSFQRSCRSGLRLLGMQGMQGIVSAVPCVDLAERHSVSKDNRDSPVAADVPSRLAAGRTTHQ